MSLQEWERDVRNRQRNIVFPDTNLNQGRFYRNIFSDKAQFNLTQRIGLLLIAGILLSVGCLGIADAVRFLLVPSRIPSHVPEVVFGFFWFFIVLCGIGLTLKAVFPSSVPARKRRKGHRSKER
jgi:hypothetical protein